MLEDLHWSDLDWNVFHMYSINFVSNLATFPIAEGRNFHHFLGSFVLFTFRYDEGRQISYSAAICRYLILHKIYQSIIYQKI